MTTEISTPPGTQPDGNSEPKSTVRVLLGRITRFEMIVWAVIAAVMLLLVIAEPEILEAPFENERTMLFTLGGTAIAALVYAAMLWLRVPAVLRVVVLVVPFALVNWWLLSPYFIDDVVDEEFSTSISAELESGEGTAGATQDSAPPAADVPPPVESSEAVPAEQVPAEEGSAPAPPVEEEPPAPPAGPVLLAAGQFVGLAGHSGTGDAGVFENPDGSLVLRFENFDIDNGPDLEVYLVPGADQTSLAEGSIHLGALKGNIGDQNYELPPGTDLPPGEYTVLVWCEAFSVEFVGATVAV
ncbi:MAG: DM13 domain-containing protein [Acidimicrobiales bacterium]